MDEMRAAKVAVGKLINRDYIEDTEEQVEFSEEPIKSKGRPRAMHADDGDFDFLSEDENAPSPLKETEYALALSVCSALSAHTPMPCALGSRAGSLPHNVKAMVHSLGLASGGVQELDGLLSSMITCATDMGTELGIAEVVNVVFCTPRSCVPPRAASR